MTPPAVDRTAELEAGLDALELGPVEARAAWWRRVLDSAVPPLLALVVIIGCLAAGRHAPRARTTCRRRTRCGSRSRTSGGSAGSRKACGPASQRGVVGFLLSVAIATPIGLLLARVRVAAPRLPAACQRPAVAALGGVGARRHPVVRARREGALLRHLHGRDPLDHQRDDQRHRPGPAAVPAGRAGPRRPRPVARPLRAAARRAAWLPGRAQAGLGVLVALADGRRAHRHAPASSASAWVRCSTSPAPSATSRASSSGSCRSSSSASRSSCSSSSRWSAGSSSAAACSRTPERLRAWSSRCTSTSRGKRVLVVGAGPVGVRRARALAACRRRRPRGRRSRRPTDLELPGRAAGLRRVRPRRLLVGADAAPASSTTLVAAACEAAAHLVRPRR